MTCAAYLANEGLNVHVVENRDVVGGAAVTEEFHPGFRCAWFDAGCIEPAALRPVPWEQLVSSDWLLSCVCVACHSNSVASYAVSLLSSHVIDELQLKSHGLKIIERPAGHFLPLSAKDSFITGSSTNPRLTLSELARVRAECCC